MTWADRLKNILGESTAPNAKAVRESASQQAPTDREKAAQLASAPVQARTGPSPREHFATADRRGEVERDLGTAAAQELLTLAAAWDEASRRQPHEAPDLERLYWSRWDTLAATQASSAPATPAAGTPAATGDRQPSPPWPPSPSPIRDPAKHWKEWRDRLPDHLASALYTCLTLWERTGAPSVQREYARLASWFHTRPQVVTRRWLEQQQELYWMPAATVGQVTPVTAVTPRHCTQGQTGPESSQTSKVTFRPGFTSPAEQDAAVFVPPAGVSPAEHLASLGGHGGLIRRGLALDVAHFLWDSARLWERDRGTDRAERWYSQYWAMCARHGDDLASNINSPRT